MNNTSPLTRFWKTVLIVVAFYIALWATLWLFIHAALASNPPCPAPSYAAAEICSSGSDLHVPSWVYQSWKWRRLQGADKMGEFLFKKISNSGEGRGKTEIATALIGAYLNGQATALDTNASLLISSGCQVLDIYLTPGELGLPALKVRCWQYN
jgi:hypothetical protein